MPEFNNIDFFGYGARSWELARVCREILNKYSENLSKNLECPPVIALDVQGENVVGATAAKFSISFKEKKFKKTSFCELKVRVVNKELKIKPQNFGYVILTNFCKKGQKDVYVADFGKDELIPKKIISGMEENTVFSVREELLEAAKWLKENVLIAA